MQISPVGYLLYILYRYAKHVFRYSVCYYTVYDKMYIYIDIYTYRYESSGTHYAPLELEGAKLPLCKVAVQHLLTPRGRFTTNPYTLFRPLVGYHVE